MCFFLHTHFGWGMEMSDSRLYKEAGVDLDVANEMVKRIKPIVQATFHSGVITDIGSFGALFSLENVDVTNPVLVSATDGVGTKLKVAFMAGKHDTIGIDLVAMNVNDIAVQGAQPLFFLDYLAIGKIELELIEAIISGIAEGCKRARCSLIGGETAEMPDFYKPGEYDLAGFAVGIVSNDRIIDGSEISVGDQIIGLASSGLHSNGYSLVRKIVFEKLKMSVDDIIEPCKRTVAEELLEPTKIYSESILSTTKNFKVKGIAHITGGGLPDNIARILPSACQAVIFKDTWEILPIFDFLKTHGNIDDEEMLRVFNCGIGLVMVVSKDDIEEILHNLEAMEEKPFLIGEIRKRKEKEPSVVFEEKPKDSQ